MKQYNLTWTWEAQSELHCGSGLSQPGQADRLVYLNANKKPEISGDTVKGALRMSAEHVLGWLGFEQTYDLPLMTGAIPYHQTAEPRNRLLALLFGQQSTLAVQPALLEKKGGRYTRTSTALDSHDGVAIDNTLRVVEILPVGTTFNASCQFWLDNADAEAMTLLLSALTATEQVGAKRGIGWGILQLQQVILKQGTQTLSPHDYLDVEHLGKLKSACAQAWEPKPLTLEATPTESSGYQWHRLILNLTEPTCIGSKPEIGNQTETESMIPANTLRGAWAKAWKLQGYRLEQIAAWLSPKTRWLPAVPYNQESKEPSVPIPLSYLCEKHETGFGTQSPHQIHDILTETPPPSKKKGKSIQWRGVGQGWMNTAAAQKIPLSRQVTMHVARDYQSGSKRTGALFSREWLAPDTFVTYVYGPSEMTFNSEIRLGKRTSAGHGRTMVVVTNTPPVFKSEPQNDTVFVQLLSPLLCRGSNGFWQTSLRERDWEKLLGLSPNTLKAVVGCSAAKPQNGWMNTWGHSTTAVQSIVPGSVWKLKCNNDLTQQVRDKLIAKANQGLGDRTHEGYGWFVVDPPWLGHKNGQPKNITKTEQGHPPIATEPPQKWPGLEALSVAEMEQILKAFNQLKINLPGKTKAPLQQLVAKAREEGTSAQTVLDECEKMASRTNQTHWSENKKREAQDKGISPIPRPGAWEPLQKEKPAREFLNTLCPQNMEPIKSLNRLRFGLEILLIHCDKEDFDHD